MKLQFKRVGLIPKRLWMIIASVFIALTLSIILIVPVYASTNDSYIASTDGDIDLNIGWYHINAYDADGDIREYIDTASGLNDTTGDDIVNTDEELWIRLNIESIFYDGEGGIYPVGIGWYHINSYHDNGDVRIEIVKVSNKNVNTGTTIFGTDTGIWLELRTVDNKSPVVSGETTFVSNVDDPKTAAYFMQYLSATDETDGDVSDSLEIIIDNFTANKSVLGNHTFTIQAQDNSGNKTTAVINVRVVDIAKPVITGNATTTTIGYKETYNLENFRKTLSVSDNYDTLTNLDIKLKTDGYTANKTKLGTYNVVYNAKDSSGNEGVFTKPIKVIDNVKPTFSGPTLITTSNTTLLTEADVRAQITAHDDIDGNLTSRIELVEDNYTGNGNKVGTYTIKYKVSDNANNTEYYTVSIQRTDKIPPVIWVQDGVSIRTTPTTPITYEIIIDILQATNQVVVNASTTFSFPLDEYTGNETEPGIYAMAVKSRSTDGNENIYNLSIVVYDEDDDGGINVNPDFDFNTFFDDNKLYFIIGGIALLSVGAYIGFRKIRGK